MGKNFICNKHQEYVALFGHSSAHCSVCNQQAKITSQIREIEELKDLLRLHLPLFWQGAFVSYDDKIALREKTQKAIQPHTDSKMEGQ